MVRRPHSTTNTLMHPPPSAKYFSAIALLFVLCITSLNFVVVQAEGSYSHTIPYGEEECLLIRVPKEPHIISGSFDLLDTKLSPDPARVRLYDSDEELIWSSKFGVSEGSFSQRGSGKHWLCLENGLTYEKNQKEKGYKINPRQRLTRSIGFSLRLKKLAGNLFAKAAENKSDIDRTADRLVDLTDKLNEKFQVLVDHMSFMKARESVHRELHEQTFTKVVKWNILEICTVVAVTFGQVLNVWYILSNRRSRTY